MMRKDAYITPTDDTDYNCHIKARTYLTNHIGSTSRHITPLVINSSWGKQTHTHTDVQGQSNSEKPGMHQPVAGARLV